MNNPETARPARRSAAAALAAVLALSALALSVPTAGAAPLRGQPSTDGTRPEAPFTAPLLPAPQGDDFYTAPDVLPGAAGDVVWAGQSPRAEVDVYGTPTNLTEVHIWRPTGERITPQVHRLLYKSTDRAGRSVPAYALLIADPQRRPDAPVIVSMHGWLGFGDQCGVMRGTWRGGWGHARTMLHYVGRGYTVIIPDGPGLAGRGEATPLVNLDAARNLLDAARAARRYSGSTGRTLFHGHSMGGTMVLGVPAEAATYAPEIPIAGVVSVAGLGHSGTGTPMWTKLIGDEKTPAAALMMQARMLAGSHPGEIDIDTHLTKLGKRRYRQTENLCAEALPAVTVADRPADLFKPSFFQLLAGQQGNYAGPPTGVPHHFVSSTADASVDSLGEQHAHLRRCAAGQPSWYTNVNATHWDAVQTAHETTGLRAWIVDVLEGRTPAGSCAPHDPFLNVGSSYTAATLLATFADTTSTSDLRLDARGDCRVRQGRLELGLSGRCAFSVTEHRKRRTGRSWHFDVAIL